MRANARVASYARPMLRFLVARWLDDRRRRRALAVARLRAALLEDGHNLSSLPDWRLRRARRLAIREHGHRDLAGMPRAVRSAELARLAWGVG
jgi:hypothetical protein